MKIKEVVQELEKLAPLTSQENYDNAGLIIGNSNAEITHILISLDCTEDIVDEAIERDCNFIISHHPIVFKALKKLNGKNYVERTIIKAIKNEIALYAIHTNLDNYRFGVNQKIADVLGIERAEILAPSTDSLEKLQVYVPQNDLEVLRKALFQAGAGELGNYVECSYSSEGIGSFKGNEDSRPSYGEKGKLSFEPEAKLEVLVSSHIVGSVMKALESVHPYEEIAYDLIPVLNSNKYEGTGMIGELNEEMNEADFLALLKTVFRTGCIKHTKLLGKSIKRIAWCGGSGSFLLSKAKARKADIYISSDFKYHEFFEAEEQLVIADIGHYESEQFTIELISELIRKKLPTFAPYLTEKITNPVNYF